MFFVSKAKYYKEHSAMIGYIYSDSSMKIRKYGLLNLEGEEVLKPIFDYIEDIYGRYMIVADIKNGTDMNYGIVRIKWNILWLCKKDQSYIIWYFKT